MTEHVSIRIGSSRMKLKSKRIRLVFSQEKLQEKLKLENMEREVLKKSIFEEVKANRINGECAICFEEDQENFILTHCKNFFCKKCLYGWIKFNKTCPYCKSKILDYEI